MEVFNYDARAVREAIKLTIAPGQVFELRAVECKLRGEYKTGIYSGYFDLAHLDELVAALGKIERAAGVYYTPNALNPDLHARALNRARIVNDRREPTTSDKDVARRRWLLIDCDVKRPAGISATDAEKTAAAEMIERVHAWLVERGFPPGLICDSGNGAHAMIPVDLPADDPFCERVVKTLAREFDNDQAKIDTTVFNAARIWKLPGTMVCKGDNAVDVGRPWRMASIVRNLLSPEVVTSEVAPQLLERINAIELHAPTVHQPRLPVNPGSSAFERCRKYVAKMKPSESDGTGNNDCFAAACVCFRFGLEVDDAIAVMNEFNARCQPPWNERDLCRKIDDARREVARDGSFGSMLDEPKPEPEQAKPSQRKVLTAKRTTDSPLLLPENLTDDENGRRFAREHGEKIRYCASWQKWLVWNGHCWPIDDRLAIQLLAKLTNDKLWDEAHAIVGVKGRDLSQKQINDLFAWAKQTASVRGTENMLRKAASESGVVVTHTELDRDPWLLNVLNGTIDLRTGQLRAHDRTNLITKVVRLRFDPNADCPLWRKFLREIMADNERMIAFLRRLVGYWLTGVIREHVLPLFIGEGGNGKSVFLTIVQWLLGADYSMKAAPDLLLIKKHPTHPTELADLHGKRLVCAIETENGRRLAESLVKELTGGDAIRARRMREDFWEFKPTHKVVLAANYRPIVKGTDNGIWRRLLIVPFTVTIPKEQQNEALSDELQAELPGILNWALLGCAEWQAEGLNPPNEVLSATDQYKAESDLLAEFIADECVLSPNARAAGGSLYEAYSRWCESNGHHAESSTAFGRLLTARGFEAQKTMYGKVRIGIGLAAKAESSGSGELVEHDQF